jgi:folate-binding protein YgfZ
MEPRTAAGAATGALLRLEGRDALPLLHRISTQSLLGLTSGQARATLFCDFRGRLLHRAVVAVTTGGVVWLLRDDALALPLAEFIERFVFREDVRVMVPAENGSVVAAPGGFGLEPGTLRERDGLPTEVQTRPDWGLALEPADHPAPGPAAAAEPRTEHARILAGLPRHGHEIAERFTPFEVGLGPEVHLDKGCYTGQEALLRMMTYGGVRRRLVRLRGAGPPPAVPHEVRAGGAPGGWLTSVVPEAEPGAEPGWTGLAVLRREAIASSDDPTVDERPAGIAHAFEVLPPLGRH